jgi:hypothetical protein
MEHDPSNQPAASRKRLNSSMELDDEEVKQISQPAHISEQPKKVRLLLLSSTFLTINIYAYFL